MGTRSKEVFSVMPFNYQLFTADLDSNQEFSISSRVTPSSISHKLQYYLVNMFDKSLAVDFSFCELGKYGEHRV